MRRALRLAERGRGKVAPNPMVGAVIVKHGEIVAEGYHHRVGQAHAEVVALGKAGRRAAGATMYVTLEPCCHTGRTGPCTEALIGAKIKRVVIPTIDPNPLVHGKGVRRLREAGIRVDIGPLRDEAQQLNDAYFGFHRNGRPFVTLKLAQTLDGRIAASNGDSKWVSGPAARRLVHRMRSETDAVLVGMGTVRADNPALTVRAVKGRNPYRVIVAGAGRFPAKCDLLDKNDDYRTVIAAEARLIGRLTKRANCHDVIFWEVKVTGNGLLDIRDLVRRAGEFGLQSLLVEGGESLATSFIKADLVDKYVVSVAPKILGQGIPSVGDLGRKKISEAIELKQTRIEQVGRDIVCSGYPRRRN